MVFNFRSTAFTMAVAGGLFLTPALIHSASADTICSTCIGFNFNYTTVNGSESATNAGQLDFTDPTLVDQSGTGSGATFVPGGAFTEAGALILTSYDTFVPPNGTGSTNSLPGVSAPSSSLYLYYMLSGTTTITGGTANITFNSGGTLTLYYDTQNASLFPGASGVPKPGSGAVAIATFTLLGGGATGTLSNGSLDINSFVFDAEQTSGPLNLLTTLTGQDLFTALGQALALETGTADVQSGAITYAACTAGQNIGGYANSECAVPSTTGFLQITGVPEPATLALFGTGLLGLGMLSRRRRKQS